MRTYPESLRDQCCAFFGEPAEAVNEWGIFETLKEMEDTGCPVYWNQVESSSLIDTSKTFGECIALARTN